MGIMNWLFGYDEEEKEEAEPQTRAETTTTPQIDDVLLQAILNGETIDREKALTLPAVSGAVDFIGNCVATMPVKLYKVKQGKVEEVENDPRVRLLNSDTHDTLDPFQFKKAMVEDYLLGRGGYAYIQRNRNEVTGLFYVEDIYISILYNYKPIHKDFEIIVQGQTYQPYDFIKLLRNTKTGAEGTGLTLEVSKALETAYNTLTYQLGLVQSGGNKKGFLLSDRRLGQDEINALKTAWANMYANNTENVVVLNQGLKFQESSNSSVEMQLDQNKKTLTDEINNIFHIHPDDFEQTFKEAIYPIVKAFETALNRDLLLEKEKKNMFFEFDVKEIVRASLKDRYESYKLAKETGFLTINEIRRAENLNWIEGMDVINVGLSAVLYDTNTHTYYTPNTDTKTTIEEETVEEMPTEETVEEIPTDLEINERYNPNHGKDGKFTVGSGGGSGSGSSGSGGSSGGSDKTEGSSGSGGAIESKVKAETEKVKSRLSNEVKPFEKEETTDINEVKSRGNVNDEEAKECVELAEKVYAEASSKEPQITQDVVESVSDAGGQMYGLAFRMKQPTSMAGKIASDAKDDGKTFEKAAEGIKDAVRYTAVIDEGKFTQGYNQIKKSMEEKGYTEMRCKNFYTMYEMGRSCQKAIQSVFEKDGYLFEFQFHTPSSQGAKELNHPLYEEQRKATTTPKRYSELNSQMTEIGSYVPDPIGVYDIETHG